MMKERFIIKKMDRYIIYDKYTEMNMDEVATLEEAEKEKKKCEKKYGKEYKEYGVKNENKRY